MKKKEFIAAVEHEVKTLKEFATKEELKNLDLDYFDPTHKQKCIYGQMTGTCTSRRAKELMDQTCILVTNGKNSGTREFKKENYSNVKRFINGANTGQGWIIKEDDVYRNVAYLSALEAYICLKDAKTKHIIEFLRGEVETLKL